MLIVMAMPGWGLVLISGSLAGTLIPGILNPADD